MTVVPTSDGYTVDDKAIGRDALELDEKGLIVQGERRMSGVVRWRAVDVEVSEPALGLREGASPGEIPL